MYPARSFQRQKLKSRGVSRQLGAPENHIPTRLIRFLLRAFSVFILLASVTLATAVYLSPDIAWRVRVVGLKLEGKIPEIPFRSLLRWLIPHSPVDLRDLADVPNANASIRNIFADHASATVGSRLYGRVCADCHGESGSGGTAPDLLASVRTQNDWLFFSTVKWGRAGTAMRAQFLSDSEIWQVHAFLRETAVETVVGGEAPGTNPGAATSVPPSMLLKADDSGDWLTYAGDYAGLRHAREKQISRQNVANLQFAWAAQLRGGDLGLEATPIVAAGKMFVTEAPEGLTALDARTGEVVWRFRRSLPRQMPLCCGSQNRGAAILNDAVFLETLDAHLIALDATTGQVRWDVKVAESHDGYSMTAAPLALDDQIIVGIAGGEYGIRGFVASFSAVDGSLQWKFDTVPSPGQPGSDSWAGDSWKHGGVPTWTTGSFDPQLGLVYWGTGNPSPVYQASARAGDNLYSNSLLALDVKTGKLRWYFQFTPADEHDWDATQEPVLADFHRAGQTIPAVFMANRNGFFYVLDRRTGQFLLAKPFVKQNWAQGISETGRPIVREEARPSHTGTVVWPAVVGGTNWWPPSFDPQRSLLFVPVDESASLYFRGPAEFHPGELYLSSSTEYAAGLPVTMAIRAIDVNTGDLRWEAELAKGGPDVLRFLGGVLSTSGDLVFTGYRDEFLALDADSGKKLWSIRLGGAIHAPPIAYRVGSVQYVSIIAGKALFTFALPESPSHGKSSTAAAR